MKKSIVYLLMFVVSLLLWKCTKKTPDYQYENVRFIPVGALLPLSGQASVSGLTTATALNIAVGEINDQMEVEGKQLRFRLVVEDTKTDPAVARLKIERLRAAGVLVVIGPYSSAEAQSCKPFADSHGMLIISQSSESQSLAISGDNLFRLIPTVTRQAEAMLKLLQADSMVAVFPIVRNDVWGTQLAGIFTQRAREAGMYVEDAVLYKTDATDIAAAMDLLGNLIGPKIPVYGRHRMAVLMVSFSEGTSILEMAGRNDPGAPPALLNWYGSSAFAQVAEILKDTTAAEFAASHGGCPSPVLGLEETARPKWMLLADQIRSVAEAEPDIFSMIAYDIMHLAAETYLAADPSHGLGTYKSTFVLLAENYFGVTGRATLDENGDKAFGNFDFWSVAAQSTGYDWTRTATYNTANGQLIRY